MPGRRKRKNNSSEDDDFQDDTAEPIVTENVISARRERRSVSYTDLYDEDLDGEAEEFGSDAELGIFGNGKINKIFLVRQASTGLEYLVTFQESSEPYAQWLSKSILNDFSNFQRILKGFNNLEGCFTFYVTSNHEFNISHNSPVHVIGHRITAEGILEFLCHYNVEAGSAFVWESPTGDSPVNLMEYYMGTRVRVSNTNPVRPDTVEIDEGFREEYKSRDGSSLRDYQIEGVNWMLKCFCAQHGCILADEMGLGKTIQCLAFLSFLNKRTDFHGPYMIVVRTNTFSQWCSEIERWSDLKYIAYAGFPETREMLQKYMVRYLNDNGDPEDGAYGFNIMLLTYDIFMKDLDFLKTINWQVLFIDEGHKIKNQSGKKHKAFMDLNVSHKIILTGTPVQGTLKELWTLLNFVSPEYFTDSTEFPEDDVENLDNDVLESIQEMVAPHLMRRSLMDVEKSMIPKDERIAFLKMTNIQMELTRLIRLGQLFRIGTESTRLESSMLHRACNHPFLVDGAESYYLGKGRAKREELLIDCSAKFLFLDRVLPVFKKMKRSVLIFSQRLKILDLLEEYCTVRKYTHAKLVGGLTEAEKQVEINKFLDKSKDVFIFLISTKSGSEGLNLTKASITIIFDPDWNPQNDLQALGRCHRIGQTQKVDVIRLITYGTYEHYMFACSQRKLRLWTKLLGNGTISDPSKACKPAEVQETEVSLQTDTLFGLKSGNDSNMAGVFASVIRPEAEREHVEDERSTYQIAEPPDLTALGAPNEDEDFEAIIESASTVLRDMKVLEVSKSIPELDISFGESDEQFLERFPIENWGSVRDVKRQRSTGLEVQTDLDIKTAKKILVYVQRHGYGEWSEINKSVGISMPESELSKFCQAATLLHFRAIDPSKVSLFPLLITKMRQDVPSFNLSLLYCGDASEWSTGMAAIKGATSMRGMGKCGYYGAAVKVCKLISNHIHKTAFSFLTSLEHHLLISEWKRTMRGTIVFDNLPPSQERARSQDIALFDAIMRRETDTVAEDSTWRVSQIFHEMKVEMLTRRAPIATTKLDFWTSAEFKVLVDIVRNTGTTFTYNMIEIYNRTGILSKDAFDVSRVLEWLIRDLSQRKPDMIADTVMPEFISHSERAPLALRSQTVSVTCGEATATIKRIMIFQMIRRALMTMQMTATCRDKCIPGQGSWTFGACQNLFSLVLRYGMDSLTEILLDQRFGFAKMMTENDKMYLKTFEKAYLKEDSQLPGFLLNESKFYMFLKWLTGT